MSGEKDATLHGALRVLGAASPWNAGRQPQFRPAMPFAGEPAFGMLPAAMMATSAPPKWLSDGAPSEARIDVAVRERVASIVSESADGAIHVEAALESWAVELACDLAAAAASPERAQELWCERQLEIKALIRLRYAGRAVQQAEAACANGLTRSKAFSTIGTTTRHALATS